MNRFTKSSLLLVHLTSLAFVSALGSVAAAHSDIFLTNVGGQVAIGGANELETANPFFDLDTQVFEAVLITGFPLPIFDYGRGEPGVFALSAGSPGFPAGATALASSAAVSFNPTAFTLNGQSDSLFYWDGSGALEFQPVGATQPNVTFSINPTPFSGVTSSDGALHVHPAYQLNHDGPGVPADGVYVAALTASVTGMNDSQPFYLVMLVDQLLVDDEAAEGLEETFEAGETFYEAVGKDFGFYEEAVAYVEANIAVPEPGTAFLSVLAAAQLLNSCRRRHGK